MKRPWIMYGKSRGGREEFVVSSYATKEKAIAAAIKRCDLLLEPYALVVNRETNKCVFDARKHYKRAK